ncbi:hypothetical protein SAMD00019534_101120 [Acytostelium subglobosum LB1]|uniref:hypothetical protein n=1 Tax=Acytostelium subglobosum LB1 TaxID=1410327 RepID=UPI000644A7A4|nr:hypothetical protein SAMD00019534_101120 [Acytostelium subglobosum LB1]GAM26937.1 hypothetical protein SAMD00019534_101120 [Acytostelium subglobosum LB1]|eukprot:XP_012750205.1 hypothetical protein SAMD00019534_101120 [Acytostelium subglobosum LB1]
MHGNIDILQHYLATTANHRLPIIAIKHIHMAIDTGNEQFVRLFLQHMHITKGDDAITISEQFKKRVIKYRRSTRISLSMLRMLEEEFNGLLYLIRPLWEAALTHSVEHNMLDSVQYILDNLLSRDSVWSGPSQNIMKKCIYLSIKVGSIMMFRILKGSRVGRIYLKSNSLDMERIKQARDSGHILFIKQLAEEMDHQSSDLLMPSKSIAEAPMTLFMAINNNDFVSVNALSHEIDELDMDTCQRMSKEMATFISSRPQVFKFS